LTSGVDIMNRWVKDILVTAAAAAVVGSTRDTPEKRF